MANDVIINMDTAALMEIKTLCGLCANKIDEAYHKVDKASRHDGWWCGEIFWVEAKLKGVAKNVNELKEGCFRLAMEASSASTRFEECVKRANNDILSVFNDTKMWEVVNDVYQGEVITPPGKKTLNLLSNISNYWWTQTNVNEMQGTTLDLYNSMIGAGIIQLPFHSWWDGVNSWNNTNLWSSVTTSTPIGPNSQEIAGNISAAVTGYPGIKFRNPDGSINLEAFRQNNDAYQVFTYGDEVNQATGMASAGCNLCATSYALTAMGCDMDPISLYYNSEKPYGSLTYGAVASQIGNARAEMDVYQLNRYLDESLNNPSQYSKPVICCAAGNNYGTHYMTVVDYARDAQGNIIDSDYMVMDPGDGTIKQLSSCGYLPYDTDGRTKIIMSCVRYARN